jgi:transcriptional regulator with XRE-family HTH domain
MRKMGNMISKLAIEQGIDDKGLATQLGIDKGYIQSLYKGKMFLSHSQLEKLCKLFRVDLQELLIGDDAYYAENVVHCMTPFSDDKNREMILNFIDSYIDVYRAAKAE